MCNIYNLLSEYYKCLDVIIPSNTEKFASNKGNISINNGPDLIDMCRSEEDNHDYVIININTEKKKE